MADKAAVSAYKVTKSDGDYNNTIRQIKKVYDAAVKRNRAKAKSEKADIRKEYDSKRADTYVNARLSAIGNNENLAKSGLAGNLYAKPTSGVSETARIAQDNTLRNDLNRLDAGEAADKSAVGLEALIAGYDADAEQAKSLAELYEDKAEQKAGDRQFAAKYALDNFEAYLAALKLQNEINSKKR